MKAAGEQELKDVEGNEEKENKIKSRQSEYVKGILSILISKCWLDKRNNKKEGLKERPESSSVNNNESQKILDIGIIWANAFQKREF